MLPAYIINIDFFNQLRTYTALANWSYRNFINLRWCEAQFVKYSTQELIEAPA